MSPEELSLRRLLSATTSQSGDFPYYQDEFFDSRKLDLTSIDNEALQALKETDRERYDQLL